MSSSTTEPITYYHQFDVETNNGRVLDLDLSSVEVDIAKLHESEINARKNWADAIERLLDHYIPIGDGGEGEGDSECIPEPVLESQEVVLQQRIVAPKLGWGKVSTRSKKAVKARRGRMYPPKIAGWTGFRQEVMAFKGSEDRDPRMRRMQTSFSSALVKANDSAKKKEIYEQNVLVSNLQEFLGRSNLIGEIAEESGGIGKTDFNLIKPNVADPQGIATSDEIAVVCESKSTHNLLLPLAATDTVRKYNMAYQAVGRDQSPRTVEWVNIAHPLAQLVGYMANNKRRFGALTSGTRTYFVRIQRLRTRDCVQISDAFFVGEENYLRAWAFVYNCGCNQVEDFNAPESWLVTSKDNPIPENKNKNKKRPPPPPPPGNSGGKKGGRGGRRGAHGPGIKTTTGHGNVASGAPGDGVQEAAADGEIIPYVAFDDVDVDGVLGHGRNGAVFKVYLKGQVAAMKQFDVGRDGDDGFNKEVEAYQRLQDVWGVLVPRPLFLSESVSRGVQFLGLQLGRDATAADDLSLWDSIVQRLEDFGIRHNDAERRNRIYVPDGKGGERLVAIDFEDWDEV